ncbi:hypothetical protein CDO73_07660 [Saccharibacillus sp. O23]|nr:hypothetical protein CDO73_07660 [Saccharibacillus sp. O23]
MRAAKAELAVYTEPVLPVHWGSKRPLSASESGCGHRLDASAAEIIGSSAGKNASKAIAHAGQEETSAAAARDHSIRSDKIIWEAVIC